MSNTSGSVAQVAELHMLKRDTSFYLGLVAQLRAGKQVGFTVLGLIPYPSLFVVETQNYFATYDPAFAAKLARKHPDIIRASRMAIKLFDGTAEKLTQMFEDLSWIANFNHAKMNNGHKGLLAPLKKTLQPDLGLFMYGQHLMGSSHVAQLNVGYGKHQLQARGGSSASFRPLSLSVGYDIGEYLAKLVAYLGEDVECANALRYGINDNLVTYRDVKAQRYYQAIFNGSQSEHLNISLSLLLYTLNYLHYVIRPFVAERHDTFFKMKYIALYHTAISLKHLQNYHWAKDMLTEESKEYLSRILSDRELKRIMSATSLRNTLVHYRIENINEANLTLSARLYGLVEAAFRNHSFESLDDLLDQQMVRVVGILEDWIEKPME